ncbi:MAG: CRTAC1 family protein [Planctomycetaceae bacterium]
MSVLCATLVTGCGSSKTVSGPEQPKTPTATVRTRQDFDHLKADGHLRMIAVLNALAKQADHRKSGLRSELQTIGKQIGKGHPSADRCYQYFQQGLGYLRMNELRQGIVDLQESERLALQIDAPRCDLNQIRFYLGVAHLRVGETENCCARNNSDSCILPIRGEGLHTRKEGSEAAFRCFLDVVEHPSGLTEQEYAIDAPAMWLLNIAAMTLGRYPQDVPEAYRCPEKAFQSSETFPVFRNILPVLGLRTDNLCGGAVSDDFDNDGLLDVFTTTFDPRGQSLVFRNSPKQWLTDCTQEAGLIGICGGLNAIQTDFNNDGFVDLFVVRGAWKGAEGQHPNSLLRNNGDGTFSDVTFEVGLAEVWAPTKTADWADFDNDGNVDLFIGNETLPESPALSELYRNNGDGRFTDIAAAAGVNIGVFCMGAVWGDYDHDHFPDLFVSNGTAPGRNLLFHNQRNGTFQNVSQAAGVERPLASFATWFWDYNNDGNLDLYVANSIENIGFIAADLMGRKPPDGVETMGLYSGDGQGHFRNLADSAGLSLPTRPMGANFGDLNGDGFPDFYLATGDVPYEFLVPNLMFLNHGGTAFTNITMAGGFGHLQKGHGVSFTDLNNDGMTDVYVQLGGAFDGDAANDGLFLNPGFDSHWVVLNLAGIDSNRAAVGTRIRAVITEDGQERSIYRHVDSGGSFGANPLQVRIGIGKATKIERLEVEWSVSGQTQVFTDVSVNRTFTIVEGRHNLFAAPAPRLSWQEQLKPSTLAESVLE